MTDNTSLPPEAAPKGVDTTVPHSPRIWNYWLGGKDNFAVDREVGDQFQGIFPGITDIARASRGFLTRCVEYLAADVGIRQFLDIGTGLPTFDNTHEVAQRVAPESRIVYVDNDPHVLAHARALLTSTPDGETAYVDADVRDTDTVLDIARDKLDLTAPVGLMMLNILGHIVDDGEARTLVSRLMGALPSGSYLAVADGTNVVSPEPFEEAIRLWNEAGSIPYQLRSPDRIARFFDGLELVEPGVVSCSLWRPEPSSSRPPAEVDEFCALGRKP